MEDNRGVREIAAYFFPKHAARIIHYASFYPTIPSAVPTTCTVSERDQIHAEMFIFFFSPFADAISLQWVPVGGISVKPSSPGAEQPFLQGPAPLSDSSRRAEMMAMPAGAFDFFFFFKDIPLLSHCFIDHRQTSLCSSAKRVLRECSICNVITQMRMAARWTDTNPRFAPQSAASLLW